MVDYWMYPSNRIGSIDIASIHNQTIGFIMLKDSKTISQLLSFC